MSLILLHKSHDYAKKILIAWQSAFFDMHKFSNSFWTRYRWLIVKIVIILLEYEFEKAVQSKVDFAKRKRHGWDVIFS